MDTTMTISKLNTLDDPFDHIVFDPLQLHISSKAYEKVKAKILQYMYCGITGAVFLGKSRIGKTRIFNKIQHELLTRRGEKISATLVTIHNRDTKTLKSITSILCRAFGFEIGARTTADQMLTILIAHLYKLASTNKDRMVVLIIDEIQRLKPEQFGVFAELHDDLQNMGIQLFIYFIGNAQESSILLKLMERDQNAHFRGRFFQQQHNIYGIQNKVELKHCLRQYDKLRFPDNSSPTYTEYFLPKPYHNGFRIVHLADEMWQTFNDLKHAYSFDSLGMQFFTSAMTPLLTAYLPQEGVEKFSHEMMMQCFNISGLIPELLSIDNNA